MIWEKIEGKPGINRRTIQKVGRQYKYYSEQITDHSGNQIYRSNPNEAPPNKMRTGLQFPIMLRKCDCFDVSNGLGPGSEPDRH
jgi:hypothetical protein